MGKVRSLSTAPISRTLAASKLSFTLRAVSRRVELDLRTRITPSTSLPRRAASAYKLAGGALMSTRSNFPTSSFILDCSRSDVNKIWRFAALDPEATTQRLLPGTCCAKVSIGLESIRTASANPKAPSRPKYLCRDGERRFASTTHTEPGIWADKISPARAQTLLEPSPSSTPQNTTDRGASWPGSRNTVCTSLISSSRASASTLSAPRSILLGAGGVAAVRNSSVSLWACCRTSKFLLIIVCRNSFNARLAWLRGLRCGRARWPEPDGAARSAGLPQCDWGCGGPD